MKKRVIENIDEAIIELEKPNRYVLVNISCIKSDPVIVDNYTRTEMTISLDLICDLFDMGIATIDTSRKSPSRRFHMIWYKRSDMII